jgi:hypothetical protein
MPIKEFIIKTNEALPHSLESLLGESFDSKILTKAKTNGAKIKVIVTTPWPKPPKKEKVIIDDMLVARLKTMAQNETELETEIGKLNGPQILKIAIMVGIPMSKTSKVPSLRAQLVKSLRSEIIWKGIAGQNQTVPSAN